MNNKPHRSALYLPASNQRAIEKARPLDCDVVILDLEDAVAPDAKAIARDQAAASVRAGDFGRSRVVVRCNALSTPWGADDCAALATLPLDAVLVPKPSSSSDIADYRGALGAEGPSLWAMIETCQAIFNLHAIAKAAGANRLTALVFGSNDLAKEMRCRPGADRLPLLVALSSTVAAARLGGLVALDGVCNLLDDSTVLEAECRQGLSLGFDGKTLIHPSQIDTANHVFAPSSEEVDQAQAIVAAFSLPEHRGQGAIRVEGKMVERLHLAEAERLLALAEAIG